jgi:hypothetical protein
LKLIQRLTVVLFTPVHLPQFEFDVETTILPGAKSRVRVPDYRSSHDDVCIKKGISTLGKYSLLTPGHVSRLLKFDL